MRVVLSLSSMLVCHEMLDVVGMAKLFFKFRSNVPDSMEHLLGLLDKWIAS